MNSENMKHFIRKGYFKTPQLLQIEITDFCPLKCPQCYKKLDNFSYIEMNKFIDIIIQAKNLGVKQVYINGGEPLMHENFIEMIDICNKTEIECTVFISGIGIDDDFCKKIKFKKINIFVSLNGSNEKINGLSRDGYLFALNAIKCLKKNSVNYGINWVARHDNINDFEKLIFLARSNGADTINIVCNKLTSKKVVSEYCTSDDYKILKKIIKQNEDIIKVQVCYDLLLSYLGWSQNNKLHGCQAGIRLMAVDLQGNFMPCSHLYYREKYNSLYDYWNNSKILGKLRNINDLKYCNECNKCRVCHCISSESYENLEIGYKECPIKNNFNYRR